MTSTAPSYDDLISHLVNALVQRLLFHRDHPRVCGAVADFVRGMGQRAQEDRRDAFFLGIVEGRLVHDGRFLFGSTLLGRKLVRFATQLRCGGFLFRATATEADISALLDLCAELREPLASLQEARARLKSNADSIQLSPPYEDPGWFGQFLFSGVEAWFADARAEHRMVPVFQSLFDTVESAHANAATDSNLDIDGARTVTERLLNAVEADGLHDLLRVVRYPNYDTYTVGHSVRVAALAVQLGMHLNLPTHTLTELGTAGLLHDVGKSKIPREILFKPARLDDEERAVMSQHPRLGAQLLAAHPHAGAMSIGAAFGHHLRRDRRGYPSIGSWHPVGKATALMHVCDVFEALTAVRPYKPALTPRRAFEIMLRDSGAFHPGALAVLLRCMGLYPPGSRVLLSSGERGTVVAAGADIERPRLQLTHDVRGCALPAEAQRELDLATEIEVSVVRLLEDPIVPPSTAELSAHRC